SNTLPTIRGGASRQWTRYSARSRSKFPSCWCTASGIRKTSTARPRSIAPSSRRTRTTTRCFWSSAPGTTGRRYARAARSAHFAAPKTNDAAYDEYVSDPSKPVPYRARPARPVSAPDSTWRQWLVDDQREASGRQDVLAFVSDVLTEPVKISGQPVANIYASTSGTDSDWVVKVIDVYPDE